MLYLISQQPPALFALQLYHGINSEPLAYAVVRANLFLSSRIYSIHLLNPVIRNPYVDFVTR